MWNKSLSQKVLNEIKQTQDMKNIFEQVFPFFQLSRGEKVV